VRCRDPGLQGGVVVRLHVLIMHMTQCVDELLFGHLNHNELHREQSCIANVPRHCQVFKF
jgi:hypothetical protein